MRRGNHWRHWGIQTKKIARTVDEPWKSNEEKKEIDEKVRENELKSH